MTTTQLDRLLWFEIITDVIIVAFFFSSLGEVSVWKVDNFLVCESGIHVNYKYVSESVYTIITMSFGCMTFRVYECVSIYARACDPACMRYR